MLRTMLTHIDELAKHIKELDAEVVIPVIGTDMTRFPTDAHISSWAGLCPGNYENAGKRKSTPI